MASVASTYARAFADVVFGDHLDADRCVAELRDHCELAGRKLGAAARLGESRDSRGPEAQGAGRDCRSVTASPSRCET